MADKTHKYTENVPGAWYVDDTCTPCRTCMDVPLADTVARYDSPDENYIYFFKQPTTSEELECAAEMAAICPQNAIGNDGEE